MHPEPPFRDPLPSDARSMAPWVISSSTISATVSAGMANPMPSAPSIPCRVDADHSALGIHQRTAGISRIDRSIGLDDVRECGIAGRQFSFRPLTMPMLMLSGKWPRGQPKAKQSSPSFARSPKVLAEKRFGVDAQDGKVGERVVSDDYRRLRDAAGSCTWIGSVRSATTWWLVTKCSAS